MPRARRSDGYPDDGPYVGARVHDADKERLTQAALELGITVSDILRTGMRVFLDAYDAGRSAELLSKAS
jgi:hypothetical protein